MKVWLVVNNWRNKYPDISDGYIAKIFTNKDNAEFYYGCLLKTDNTILREIELPDMANTLSQQKFTGVSNK